jgi:uncharacterized membrane protein HdeD (DUF308 family)
MVEYGVEEFMRDADRPRNTNILLGTIFLLLGIIAILLPKITTGFIVFGFGAILIIAGISAIVGALRGKEVTTAGLYMGLVLIAVGILIFLFPVLAGHIFTFILLLLLLGTGLVFFYWVHLIGLKESGYLPLAGGIVAIFFAILIILGWFGDVNPWLIGVFVGIDLLFNGVILLILGVTRR